MALSTLVKVGEITNLSDARYCAGMGVEMLGFNLNPDSETYISPEKFKEITEWVAGVKFVGEVEGISLNSVTRLISDYNLDYVQLSFDQRALIYEVDLPAILVISGSDFSNIQPELTKLTDSIECFLIDDLTNPKEIEVIAEQFPVIWNGVTTPEGVISTLDQTKVRGLALKGSAEEKPGFKDYDQLADILEALETDD